MSEAHHFSYTVAPRESGLRLDVFLLSRWRLDFPERTFFRADVIRCIRGGEILVSGKVGKPSTTVSLGDSVQGILEERERGAERNAPLNGLIPSIVFENEHFRVLDKPAGLQVHPSGKGERDTLMDWLQTQFPKESALLGADARFGIVHRLDKETSGLLLVARTRSAWESLKQLFQDREIQKTYHALVFGHLASKQGSIDGDILSVDHSLRRRVASVKDSAKRKTARTEYEVEKRFRDFDLVKVSPKTGRTHQIRVHLLSVGHPIVGDKLYGHRLTKRLALDSVAPERHLLHAGKLQFACFGEEFSFGSPLPADFVAFLGSLDEIA
jgi:23S rRNA pseudouridine1911/1915/1917 synthase